MAYDGYLRFGGSELVNAERTAAYALAMVPSLALKNCAPCDALRYDVNQKVAAIDPDMIPYGTKAGAQVDRETRYTDPATDNADWYDPDDPDSADFAGLYPLSITGLDDDSRSAEVVQNSGNGGSAIGLRKATKEVRVSGLLIARTPQGLDYGKRWLRQSLDANGCDANCDGDDLCFYAACPPSIRLDGYDYDSMGVNAHQPAPYGWRMRGPGTFTTDYVGNDLTVASGDVSGVNPSVDEGGPPVVPSGPSFIEYSPLHAVEDDMRFSVEFDPATVLSAVQRRNIATNPRFRTVDDVSNTIRTNLAKNPTGRFTSTNWAASSGSVAVVRAGDDPSDANRPDLGGGPVQWYLTSVAVAAVAKAGSGLRTTVTLLNDTTNLRIAGLASTGVTNMAINVQWFNSSAVQIGATVVGANIATPGSAWTSFAQGFTPPAGAVTATISFVGASSEAGSFAIGAKIIDLSAVVIEHATLSGVAHDYFDGTYLDSSLYYNGGATSMWLGGGDSSESVIVGPAPADAFTAATGVGLYRSTSGRIRVMTRAARTADPIATTPAMPLAAGSYVAGRLSMRRIAGTNGSARLTFKAYNASNTLLATVAQSALVSLPTPNVATTVAAPSTAVLPAGTTYIKAEVTWDNGGGTFSSAAVLDFDSIVVEPRTTSGSAGTYFDGSTPDTATLDYRWDGAPNASTSYSIDRTLSVAVPVRLEAFADGVRVASVEGNSIDGSITLVADGRGHSVMQFRLVPMATDSFIVIGVRMAWHLYIDFERVHADYVRYVEFYGPEGPGAGGGVEDPVGTLIENQFRKYRRQMRRVTCVEGPTVTETYPGRSACMARVEFILVAGVPHIFGDEVYYGAVSLQRSAYPDPIGSDAFVIDPIPRCSPVKILDPVVNPNCTIPVNAPVTPSIASTCTKPGPVTHRYGLLIDGALMPKFADMVPILQFYGEDFTSERVNVLFYPMPIPSESVEGISPCSVCAEFTLQHFDTNGIVLDASREQAYSIYREVGFDDSGNATFTGRTSNRPAAHLFTALDGAPMEWPVLRCGVNYLMVVETYANRDSSIGVSLVPRL